MSLQQQLQQPYAREAWQHILHGIFPDGSLKLFATPQPLAATQEKVKSTHQLGVITLPDGNTIALLEVETSDQIKLARNRVGLRNFVSTFIDEAGASAVLAVFHQKNAPDWRLTYAARQTTLDEKTFAITQIETAPRRFTFLLGANEPCKTAAARLASLLEKSEELKLGEVENAFSIEKLSKEFFDRYQQHYTAFLTELLSPERAADTRARFGIPAESTEEAQTKADKPIRDFTKKLLGRLVFLAFLQRKGWLHAPAVSTDWATGDKDFLRTYLALAQSKGCAATFHSTHLAPLFFEALNTERPGQVFPLTGTRMPYLNGGLFEPDRSALRTLDFPPHLFADLFSFFAEYNFTIDENDPEDHEVGIDPEMLSHIFENLLEDNKDKGAYYTPKVIVSTMCRQSLLRYLHTHLGPHPELAILIQEKDPANHDGPESFVAQHRKKIINLLDEVKICDHAIGSGAFPIGMLLEILWTRIALEPHLNTPADRAELKKHIIANCIHGVDIDSGAVDIARLRFWLTLVVDEEIPSPLPNLDYKIMQGNSLLESFQGIPLGDIHEATDPHAVQIKAVFGVSQHEFDLMDQKQEEFRVEQKTKHNELLESTRAYFAARKPELKAALRTIIDKKVIDHISHCISGDVEKISVRIDQQTKISSGKLPKPKGWTEKKSLKTLATLKADLTRLESAHLQLEQTTRQPERPYFLWHLLFRDVFEQGGFDIVIANPPYVRQELIKDQKPLIEAEGYTTYTGTADLLVYFYERATTLLKPNGVLTFITSNKFYRAGYGEKLRQFLAENLTLHTLIDFRDAPVFNGVIAYASILIGQKQTAPAGHAAAALVWDLAKPASALPHELAHKTFPIAQSSLTPDGWRLVSPEVEALLTKLRQTGTPLGEYVEGRFYYGIKTGFNEAFVIDGKKRDELIAADPNSEQIIKPFLRGRDVKRWQATHADLWLIKIESSANAPHPWKDAKNPWETFSKTYPAIAAHFESLKNIKDKMGITHWKRLNDRDDQGTYFWELRSCAYWQEFEKPKIIYPDIYEHQSFMCDTSGSYLSNTIYFIPTEETWMSGLLNSDLIEFFYALVSNKARGGYLRAFSDYIQLIPIPPATPADKTRLTALAEACAEATRKQDAAALATLESEINQIVYRLFALTPAEIAIVEGTAP
jgi:hypothetical protein